MTPQTCKIIGAPVHTGASQPGCIMGPDAICTAGLIETLHALGHSIRYDGNLRIGKTAKIHHNNQALKNLAEMVEWTNLLSNETYSARQKNQFPITLGGDHSIAAGSVSGLAKAAAEKGQPFFVLWLDAHPDFHDLESTESGNLHGVPVAYFTGAEGFSPYFPPPKALVKPGNVCMMGIRSVDLAERERLSNSKVRVHDMRSIDQNGIAGPLRSFLDRVKAAEGTLHVSLDVDFLDPGIAPGVGTTVPGGATFREAHLVMEMLCDSGLVSSLDLVELNPFLDERGRTATLLVDLCASLMGRRVLDKITRSY